MTPARILVVEDDEDIRNLIIAHLTRGGHTVRAVANGADAVEACQGPTLPELLVLDVGLPDTSGFDLLVRLRAEPGCADLPSIFLSARVQEADVERGRALGAIYLTKPFVASALLGKIESALLAVSRPAW